jgi:hypothetical protein
MKMADIYYGTKKLAAKPLTRGEYNAYRGWTTPADENPLDEGYLVEYADGGKPNMPGHVGYISWSPKDVFEAAYQPVTAMSFGHALVALKEGHKVARQGWNGKGMWLALSPFTPNVLPADGFWSGPVRDYAIAQGGTAKVLPSITMKTATGEILIGWLASQSDMLAND